MKEVEDPTCRHQVSTGTMTSGGFSSSWLGGHGSNTKTVIVTIVTIVTSSSASPATVCSNLVSLSTEISRIVEVCSSSSLSFHV